MTISLTADDRGNVRSMPPAELIDQADIRKAVEAHAAAIHAAYTASQDATALEQARPQAVEKDRLAFADALEAGKRDPGEKATVEHDKQVASAQRHAEAAKVVVGRRFRELVEAIAEHEAEWSDLVDKRQHRAREAWAAAVDALADVHAELAQVSAVKAYIDSEGQRFKAGSRRVPMRRTSSDAYVPVDDLLAALRTLAVPPEAQALTITGDLRIVELGRDAA